MSLRQRIAGWIAPPEQRAAFDIGSLSFGLGSGTAAHVHPMQAESLAAVQACVAAISSGIASLPAYVYRATDGGRVPLPSHPVSRLIAQPNEWQTWPDWIEWTLGQVLLWGNALAAIETDGGGAPVSLTPIPWSAVVVTLLPSGRIAYDVTAYVLPFGGTGQTRRLLAGDVFHLKDRADNNGIVGRSRISRCGEVVHTALELQEYSAALWRNGATPSGALTLPAGVGPDGLKRMKAWFTDNHAGTHNARKPLLMDSGSSWTPMSASPEDAQVLASRQFTVAEICRVFGVPPPLVQDYTNNTFTNAATAELWFASRTLLPWVRKIEAEFQRSVFADSNGPFSLEIDMSALTRGDFATRTAATVALVGAGIMSTAEARSQFGLGALPADPAAPGGTADADDAAEGE